MSRYILEISEAIDSLNNVYNKNERLKYQEWKNKKKYKRLHF